MADPKPTPLEQQLNHASSVSVLATFGRQVAERLRIIMFNHDLSIQAIGTAMNEKFGTDYTLSEIRTVIEGDIKHTSLLMLVHLENAIEHELIVVAGQQKRSGFAEIASLLEDFSSKPARPASEILEDDSVPDFVMDVIREIRSRTKANRNPDTQRKQADSGAEPTQSEQTTADNTNQEKVLPPVPIPRADFRAGQPVY